jgi:outer membrane biosynthesis protein TonB
VTLGERTGLGISATAHIALFGILSLGWLAVSPPPIIPQTPVDVLFIDEVGLEAAIPQASEAPPAPSVAPETGPPEHAPALPKPEAIILPKPAPVVKTQPKPDVVKPAPPAPPVPVVAKKPTSLPRGSRLGPDFLNGIAAQQNAGTSTSPRAKVGAREVADLANAIRRQVQPCADRITSPGPGSNVISTKLNLRLNTDGSFATRPEVISQSGVNDENSRYARRVGELATAAFVQCAPFDLPAKLYDGWKNFNLNYKLPD